MLAKRILLSSSYTNFDIFLLNYRDMIDPKHNMSWNINSSIHKNKSIVRWNINGKKQRCIISVGLLVLFPHSNCSD